MTANGSRKGIKKENKKKRISHRPQKRHLKKKKKADRAGQQPVLRVCPRPRRPLRAGLQLPRYLPAFYSLLLLSLHQLLFHLEPGGGTVGIAKDATITYTQCDGSSTTVAATGSTTSSPTSVG
jgi:hypothetical protein